MTEAFDVRRADNSAHRTPARTERLEAIKAEHRGRRAELQADGDLTPEAKARHLRDLDRDHGEKIAAEADRIMVSLDSDIEAAYRKAHAPEKPSKDPQAETARELRLARVRSEVIDAFAGGMDPLMAYKEAVRLGDTERARVVASVGPMWLDDATRKRRLAELVEENVPESRRKAKQDLERLEREKRSLEAGLAMQRGVRGNTARRLGA